MGGRDDFTALQAGTPVKIVRKLELPEPSGHKKTALRTGRLIYNLAATYSHMAFRHTTIGATAFHFRVRNGAGWFRYAMTTRILNSAGAEPKLLRASMPIR